MMKNWTRNQQNLVFLLLDTEADDTAGIYDVFITLTHDWGGTVVAETRATRNEAKSYQYTFTAADLISAGVHKITWRYTISGTDYYKYEYAYVYDQYITKTSFFDNNPTLETEFDDAYELTSLKVRDIINTYCGQNFYFYPSKYMTFDGDGSKTIHLGHRLDDFSEVLIDSVDYTTLIELTPGSKYYIRFKTQGEVQDVLARSSFPNESTVKITGDWGWGYVPSNITSAAEILIRDHLTDDHDYFSHGVDQVWQDHQRFEFKDSFFETTGNLDADLLLMDYVYWVMDYVT